MAVQTGAGTTFALTSAAPATQSKPAYEAMVFTEAGEVSEFPARIYEVAPWNNVTHRGQSKAKGGYSYSPQTITLGIDPADAGQALIDHATQKDTVYTIRIAHPSFGAFYGRALIMGGPKSYGDVSAIATRQVTLEYVTILEMPSTTLTFSDGTPLTFSDSTYLEFAA